MPLLPAGPIAPGRAPAPATSRHGARPVEHTTWCDPAECDLHDIDPRHTSPVKRWNADGPGVELGLAVSRTDYVDVRGEREEAGWTMSLSAPLADLTVRDGRVVIELSDDDAIVLQAQLDAGRAWLRELRDR
jgi:hypothetical protein